MAEGFITRRGGKGGVDVSDATAVQSDVLQGKTFYAGDETIKTGTIPSKGAETFTPTTTNQTIAANQFLSGTQTILGDADLVPSNIRNGTTIFGVTGTLVPASFYLSFDGVDDYVEIVDGSQVYSFSENWSYEIEFEMKSLSGDQIIKQFHRDGDGRLNVSLQTEGSTLQIRIRDDGSNRNVVHGSINTNEIYNVKVSYNASNNQISLDVNGTVTSSTFTQTETVGTFPIEIGREGLNNQKYANMNLYFLKINIDDTPFLEYLLNEGQGTTLNDNIGNNDGTIVGATWEQD